MTTHKIRILNKTFFVEVTDFFTKNGIINAKTPFVVLQRRKYTKIRTAEIQLLLTFIKKYEINLVFEANTKMRF